MARVLTSRVFQLSRSQQTARTTSQSVCVPVFALTRCARTFHDSAHNHTRRRTRNHDYDLVVIGGGSGGTAAADEAAAFGAKVAVLDWVEPSPLGNTTWGIGGTCVNVGCIPKKLMVYAARAGEALDDAQWYGWRNEDVGDFADDAAKIRRSAARSNWRDLSRAVQNHVRSLNFGIQGRLIDTGVDYFAARGTLQGTTETTSEDEGHRITLDYGDDGIENHDDDLGLGDILGTGGGSPSQRPAEITTKNVLIAVGGRPQMLSSLEYGAEHCITSDDIFWKSDLFAQAEAEKRKGRVVVVGGGYIALECAGFLNGLGHHVTLVNRSDTFLRGFDEEASARVVDDLRLRGVEVVSYGSVRAIDEKSSDDPHHRVHIVTEDAEGSREQILGADVILLAVGRSSRDTLSSVGAVQAGFRLRDDKLLVDKRCAVSLERGETSSSIFAIGDCATDGKHKQVELTPVAIKQGRSLAATLFSGTAPGCVPPLNMDLVPSTVFTPLEYSFCGLSETDARQIYGPDQVDVLHAVFDPLENSFLSNSTRSNSFVKIVIKLPPGGANVGANVLRGVPMDATVVGAHLLGKHSGETIQGLAVAMNAARHNGKLFVRDLWSTCGIHPTNGEELVRWGMVSKSSGDDPHKSSC